MGISSLLLKIKSGEKKMGKLVPDQNREDSYFHAKPETKKKKKGCKTSFEFNFNVSQSDSSGAMDSFSPTGFQKTPTSTDDVV